MQKTMTWRPRCDQGHELSDYTPSFLAMFMCSADVCRACTKHFQPRERRLSCTQCRSYAICEECGLHGSAIGEGPYTLRVYVPPGACAGDALRVNAPDGEITDVRLPDRVAPGVALDVRYDVSRSAEQVAKKTAREHLLTFPAIIGYRWFLVLAFGLVQILVAPSGCLFWLPPEKVLMSSRSAWCLWIVLASFVLFSTGPMDELRIGWVRFASAALQGFIVGHLLVFDTTTLLGRLGFDVLLGIANGFDRLGATVDFVTTMPIVAMAGARGVFTHDGQHHRVQLWEVADDRVKIKYIHQPVGRPDLETVDITDSRLVLGLPPQHTLDGLKERAIRSFPA